MMRHVSLDFSIIHSTTCCRLSTVLVILGCQLYYIGNKLKLKWLGTSMRDFSLSWDDPPLVGIFWSGKIHLKSEPHLLMAAYIKDMEEEGFLLAFALSGKFTPSWAYFFRSSTNAKEQHRYPSPVDCTITGFLDFSISKNHCWTSWTTAHISYACLQNPYKRWTSCPTPWDFRFNDKRQAFYVHTGEWEIVCYNLYTKCSNSILGLMVGS